MGTQYTRVYVDVDTGEVAHVHTQDTPLTFDPVEDVSRNLIHTDMELDLDSPNHVHASEIREGLEYKGGAVAVKKSAKSRTVAASVMYTKDNPRTKPLPRAPEPGTFEEGLIGEQ